MGKVVTNVGLKVLSNRVKGLLTEPVKIGWGTGTTEPVVGNTGLQTEDTTGGYARTTGISSIVTTLITDDTYQISGSLTALAALTITEWGVFDTAGNLLLREVLAAGHALAIGGTLNFIFKIQFSRCSV